MSTIVEYHMYIVLGGLVGHYSHTAHVHNGSAITVKAPYSAFRLRKSNT